MGSGIVGYRTYTLRQRERELNRKVEERTEELAAAKQEAERMNQVKSSFLATMSHEIRTPLTSVIGFAEAIGDEADSGDADNASIGRFADLIQRSGRGLLETLNSVLNLSKLEAGEMDVSVERVDLADAARDVAELFGPQAEEASVTLHVEVPDEPIWGRADEGALRIVLRNFVGNALKCTEEEGAVWVRVRDVGDEVAVEVEDTGIGMDPDRVPSLFRAFEQETGGQGHVEGGRAWPGCDEAVGRTDGGPDRSRDREGRRLALCRSLSGGATPARDRRVGPSSWEPFCRRAGPARGIPWHLPTNTRRVGKLPCIVYPGQSQEQSSGKPKQRSTSDSLRSYRAVHKSLKIRR